MRALIDEMAQSIEYWLAAAYKAAPPRMAALVAADATPSEEMQRKFRQVARRWLRRFDDAAPKIAEAYLQGSFKATDSAMRQALKDAGLSVKFTLTPAMRDAFNASLAENVGLIRSIPEEYLLKVEGVVARSYTAGRDLETMVAQIRKLYPEASNRAVLIARDQSNKANAVVTRARQLELGIEEALWLHSHGGKVPRPDHLAADGRRYKVAQGCKIGGKFISPGWMINCRCTSRSILPGF
jgi:SPP1 gp7 family putative phage head morphogenesis protein